MIYPNCTTACGRRTNTGGVCRECTKFILYCIGRRLVNWDLAPTVEKTWTHILQGNYEIVYSKYPKWLRSYHYTLKHWETLSKEKNNDTWIFLSIISRFHSSNDRHRNWNLSNYLGRRRQMSYVHSKYWEDADFGQEHKRAKRKNQCLCEKCQWAYFLLKTMPERID